MPEGRMLKKLISTSLKLAKLNSDSARLLYTWLLPHLDIEGRFSADPHIVKGYVVPRLKMTPRKIKEYLEDMAKNTLIILYEIDGDKFLQLAKFKDFQLLREDRESKSQIPAPTKNSTITPGVIQENSGTSKLNESKLNESKLNEKTEEFSLFWNYYNYKVAKKDAQKAFEALRRKGETFDNIMEAAKGYFNHLKNEKVHSNFEKAMMYPATFLRNEKYKDFLGVKYKLPM